jgi:hypothetical protein
MQISISRITITTTGAVKIDEKKKSGLCHQNNKSFGYSEGITYFGYVSFTRVDAPAPALPGPQAFPSLEC